MIVSKLKLVIYLLLCIPHLFAFCYAKNRNKIIMDINAFLHLQKKNKTNHPYRDLYKLLVLCPEYRNVFYMRLGPRISHILMLFLKAAPLLSLDYGLKNAGGGFLVQHGNSTIVIAKSIGENFWVNQNVTVGWRKDGCPTIGNNVRIGTGAVVIGPIIIGDNVNIGAGAIVVKDVPSNCTVVSPHAYIVKKDGVKTNMQL